MFLNALRKFRDHPVTFWLLLTLPAITMLSPLFPGGDPGRALHPTGEFAARFLIICMMLTPLRMLFPRSGLMRWLVRRRRYLGVAAFGYAMLHLVYYVMDVGSMSVMLGEATEFGILTGWIAFLIFVPLALTSNNASIRWLGSFWKTLQRFTYPAAILVLLHWSFVGHGSAGALVQFLPLAGLEIYRVWVNLKSRRIIRQYQLTAAE